MKGPWIVLAISLCTVARPAAAQHEPPSHDDRGSGDVGHGDAGSNDTGHGDSGGHDSPADSSPSSGGDSGDRGSGDASGSQDTSPSWSDPGSGYSHDSPDTGSVSGGGSSDSARSDTDSGPPPRARPRDPDSVESPPTDAQGRHPRPEAGPDDGRLPNPPETAGGIWDDEDRLWHGHLQFDYDGRDAYPPDPYRKPSRQGGPVQLFVEPDEAAVYVDGHYAGVVKALQGKPTWLYLLPGGHEVAFVLEGHRTSRLYVQVPVDVQVIKVHVKMERTAAP